MNITVGTPPRVGGSLPGRAWGAKGLLMALGLSLLGHRALAQELAPDSSLYRCKVYVTGTDMRSRPAGLERCVRDVLVRASGDPGLAEDPRVLALGARSAGMVRHFAYLDRMTDMPNRDEQGTRDRPYDLVGHVDPAQVAVLLRELGSAPWIAPRPTLFARVTVQSHGLRFDMTADGLEGERQRQALLAAADTFGVIVALPTVGQTGAPPDGAVVLEGSLDWSEADAGWVCTWHVTAGGAPQSWTVRGVSFDEAFRAGVGGTTRLLAKG